MNTAVLESITDAQKEQIFDPLFKEVHDKTIIGYLVTLIREEGGPVHETILFNKTVQNFSNLRKLSGGSYTGEPVSAARAALASAEIFKKDSRNCWEVNPLNAERYYKNIKGRLMTYNNKRLMKMAKKNLESGLGQRMNEIEALLDPDNTKRTLDISPKVIDQYSQMSQKLGIYKKLNDYINSLPLDSIKDLLKNPIFDNRTFKEGAYDMSTELEGMLNLYHFFRPMIYGHSKITNYVFEVTTKIGAVKMIDKALMDIICSVDNLQQSKQDVNNLPPQMVKKEEEQRIPLGNLTNIVKNENASDLLVNQYMSTAFGGSSVKQEENICVNLEKSCEDWKDDDSVCSTEEFLTPVQKKS